MKDELTNARNDLWNTDKLLCLTQNQLKGERVELESSPRKRSSTNMHNKCVFGHHNYFKG